MNDRKLHDEIVTSVLESVTGVTIDKMTGSMKLQDLDPTIELAVLGMKLHHAAAIRGITLGPILTVSIQKTNPNQLTISNLRKMVAAAGGDEDFDIPWPVKKR